MNTEFEISTCIRFWGDRLEPIKISDYLRLDINFCEARKKGEIIREADKEHKEIRAKTGLFEYVYNDQFPEERRNPEIQLKHMTDILATLQSTFFEEYCIDQAEFSINIYYGNYDNEPTGKDVDFYIPEELLVALCKHHIRFRVTALP